ncbi:L,D-transpeptidase [Nocardioides sp. URHA0020]|uniref:L,D-transpeptidase n=1 Tax=Nocardioides sp. URHA0020 TaxID=1380392 RepID=UPI000490D793|nr:Ig-like domain-containing protein [Nocardioides sp. URHA0020]
MSDRGLRPRAATAALILAALALTACDSKDVPGVSSVSGDSSDSPSPSASAVVPVRLVANVQRGATDVPVDTALTLTARSGTIRSVEATSASGSVAGKVAADGSGWKATGRLEPGASYVVRTTAVRDDGKQVVRTLRFATQALSLEQQTYASVAPLADETVGVGMPVIVTFDVPVTDRAAFEKHMTVTAQPAQRGAWHWLSDTEAHWRPKHYWRAGTDVHVDVDVNSVSAGNGIYGQESRELDFHVGARHVYKVSAKTHQMKVLSNGKLIKTIPITTGKPGFTTRSGVKVIIEKFSTKRMNSETVGITGSEAYDLDDVKWAMRLTYSGEFIHGAPWSVGQQGYANVSHGCTGMSDANAKWLFDMSRRGDVVEYTGTDRPMTFSNGYGDWNESFSKFQQGSALS